MVDNCDTVHEALEWHDMLCEAAGMGCAERYHWLTVQVEAEQAARAAAKEGLGRKLREAEARVESLAETVEELRAGLDRQRAAADYRSELLPTPAMRLPKQRHGAFLPWQLVGSCERSNERCRPRGDPDARCGAC
jgi:hypothetical protein